MNETLLEDEERFVQGFDMAYPFTSLVTGYIYCNRFYGRIQLENNIYYVERLHKFPSIMKANNIREHWRCNSSLSIIYNEKDYIGPIGQYYDGNIQLKTVTGINRYELLNDSITSEHFRRRRVARKSNQKPIGKICSILLIGDSTFLYRIAQGDTRLATLEMISYLQEAEKIFRCTDFNEDGISDNVGFKIKYINVLNNAGRKDPDLKSKQLLHPNKFLLSLTHLTILEDVCLGVVFTAKSFMNQVIGVSFTAVDRSPQSELIHAGGICERPTIEGTHLNLLAISTVINSESRLTQSIIQVALAHEIGHSFGSFHDPETSECSNHLMSAISKPGYSSSNYRFSICSRRNIAPIIFKKSDGCLDPDEEPFCGNEIVESGEDCDCGLYTDCKEYDPCCYPRGSVHECHVNIDKQCHPSQGVCCLPTCMYRNLTYMGIDCEISTPPKRCPCNDANRCKCGYFGQCLDDDECHSIECARIGLIECACPEQSTSCHVCCYLNFTHKCVPSHEATIYIYENQTILQKLQAHEWYNPSENLLQDNSQVRENQYCVDKNDCFQFEYHFWPIHDFCVYKGNLGVCSAQGKCMTVPSYKQLSPTFTAQNLQSNGKNSGRIIQSDCIIVIYNILFLFFCI